VVEIPFLFTLTPTLSLSRLKTGSSTREREFLTFYEFINIRFKILTKNLVPKLRVDFHNFLRH